jgi:hypothetical protein
VIGKKTFRDKSLTVQSVESMAKVLRDKNHNSYLQNLIAVKNENPGIVQQEAVYELPLEIVKFLWGLRKMKPLDTLKEAYNSIKNTIFGILPLIRSIIYLRYKRKADTIVALESQAAFLRMNIEQLSNLKTMDPKQKEKIIQRQEAYILAFQRKAEKLRAELEEGETQAAEELKKDDGDVKKPPSDDLIIEGFSFQLGES